MPLFIRLNQPPARRVGVFDPARTFRWIALAAALLLAAGCSSAGPAAEPAPAGSAEEPAEVADEVTEPPVAEPTEAPAAEEPAEEEAPASEESAYPQTYTTVFGSEITIESRPERIISLAPSITEMLYAIGAGPQVVGRTDFDNYPPEVEELPSIGGFSASAMSIETILDLEPDLVIAGSVLQAEIVDALEESGITVYAVEPNTIQNILDRTLTLGEITGHVEEAQTVVADMSARVETVQAAVADIPEDERVTVFYEIWHEPLTTTSNETYIGELIELAGGINIFADAEGAYPTVSAEEIIARDPDVILGPSSHGDQLTPEMISERPGWQSLSAMQNERIYILDGDVISRAGPRVVDALEALAVDLYPERFSE
jgi:iron complex transport system substrate-binding protein